MISDRLKEVMQEIDLFSVEWDKCIESVEKYGRAIKTLQTSYDDLTGTRIRQMQKRVTSVRSLSSGMLPEKGSEEVLLEE